MVLKSVLSKMIGNEMNENSSIKNNQKKKAPMSKNEYRAYF